MTFLSAKPAMSKLPPAFEFAISGGEGTLISYGVIPLRDAFEFVWLIFDALTQGFSLIVAPCAPDCETGRVEA